jgi:hypothetical protein
MVSRVTGNRRPVEPRLLGGPVHSPKLLLILLNQEIHSQQTDWGRAEGSGRPGRGPGR